MLTVGPARDEDIDALIELEAALFAQDAGVHDPFSDPTWPRREGRQDFEDLMASPEGLVLAAWHGGAVVGLLAGYAAASSPTRQPVEYAILRTMFVVEDARRMGTASQLIKAFLGWAQERGCVEAHVDHYSANEGAGRLYEAAGFTARSVSRVLPLI